MPLKTDAFGCIHLGLTYRRLGPIVTLEDGSPPGVPAAGTPSDGWDQDGKLYWSCRLIG